MEQAGLKHRRGAVDTWDAGEGTGEEEVCTHPARPSPTSQ